MVNEGNIRSASFNQASLNPFYNLWIVSKIVFYQLYLIKSYLSLDYSLYLIYTKNGYRKGG